MSTQKHKAPITKEKTNSHKLPANAPMLFGKMNYMFTAVSLLVLVIGFALMSGKEGDIYDFRRTTLAPIVVIIGFCIGFVAIFYKKKEQNSAE
jgi:hypothetical protein